LLGDEPIIIEHFLMGSRGLLWVRLWEVKILWVRIMGVTLVMVLCDFVYVIMSKNESPTSAEMRILSLNKRSHKRERDLR
jgi:hypothetical protein